MTILTLEAIRQAVKRALALDPAAGFDAACEVAAQALHIAPEDARRAFAIEVEEVHL